VTVREAFASYRETLPASVRFVLDRFEFKDIAIKVVGVGSVGTACFVALLMAGDHATSALARASSSSAKRAGCPAKNRRWMYWSAGEVSFFLAMDQSSCGGTNVCRCGLAANRAFRCRAFSMSMGGTIACCLEGPCETTAATRP
jgi:hypothetical protein